MHLDLVSHQIREQLDEIKRQEIDRIRKLAREKMKTMDGTQIISEMIYERRGMKYKSWVILPNHQFRFRWVNLLSLITHR